MNSGDKILAWLDAGGAGSLEDMPWQTRDPYRVWVSEIMLQQTQVAVVRDFYVRFIQKFPNIRDLAKASLDEVLRLWAGMGYYARARNMHRTAKILISDYDGIFPDDIGKLCELPGIGRSTAGAILSMTMNKPHPVLDTNVKRVIIRLKAIRTPAGAGTDRALWSQAQELMPSDRFGDYNKAMMRLGARVCRSQQPTCPDCPLIDECIAFAKGLTEQLPVKKKQTPKPTREVFFALIINANAELMLKRRPETGIWGGLWCFPQFASEKQLKTAVTDICEGQVLQIKSLPARKHTFSHCIWSIQPRLVFAAPHIKPQQAVAEEGNLWYSMHRMRKEGGGEDLGMPPPVFKLMKEATKDKSCAKYFV